MSSQFLLLFLQARWRTGGQLTDDDIAGDDDKDDDIGRGDDEDWGLLRCLKQCGDDDG